MNSRSIGRQARYSISLYKKLLSIFPSEFNRDFGDQMSGTFEDMCRSVLETRGTPGLLNLWILAVVDLAQSLLREYYAVWRCDMKLGRILSTALGVILLGYSMTFAVVNLLIYQLGFSGIGNPFDRIVSGASSSPSYALMNTLIITGPMLAFLLLLSPLLRIRIDVHGQRLVTIVVNRGGRLNSILLGLCLAVGGIFVLYVTVENLPCLLGQQFTC